MNIKTVSVVYDVAKLRNKSFYNKKIKTIKEYRVNKINSLKNDIDQIRSLGAECAIQEAFKLYGLNYETEDVMFDENGKPFLKSKKAYFNYSHSGNKAFCVVSNVPLGCDVEEIKESKIDIAKRFFTFSEYELINRANGSEMFYKIWCAKESFVKCIGLGLKMPLNSFELKFENNKPYLTQSFNNKKYSLYLSKIDNYQLAICFENENLDLTDIEIVNIKG